MDAAIKEHAPPAEAGTRAACRLRRVQLAGLLLVEQRKRGFVVRELGFEVFDFRAVLVNRGIGEELMQLINPRFTLGDFGFDVRKFAVGEFAFAAFARGTVVFGVVAAGFLRAGRLFGDGGAGSLARPCLTRWR